MNLSKYQVKRLSRFQHLPIDKVVEILKNMDRALIAEYCQYMDPNGAFSDELYEGAEEERISKEVAIKYCLWFIYMIEAIEIDYMKIEELVNIYNNQEVKIFD